MIDQANELISRMTGTAQGVGALAAIAIVLIVFLVTRSLVKVLSAMILAGLVLFAVNKPEWFRDKTGEDLETGMGRPPALVVDSPAPLPPPSPTTV